MQDWGRRVSFCSLLLYTVLLRNRRAPFFALPSDGGPPTRRGGFIFDDPKVLTGSYTFIKSTIYEGLVPFSALKQIVVILY